MSISSDQEYIGLGLSVHNSICTLYLCLLIKNTRYNVYSYFICIVHRSTSFRGNKHFKLLHCSLDPLTTGDPHSKHGVSQHSVLRMENQKAPTEVTNWIVCVWWVYACVNAYMFHQKLRKVLEYNIIFVKSD